MTKRRPKPSDPMRLQAWHEAEAERQRRADDKALYSRQPDVALATDPHKPGARLDVFAMLHQRHTLTSDHLLSSRRLEEDILAWRGMDHTRPSVVARSPAKSITPVNDRMVDAGVKVKAVFAIIGGPNARLLTEILDPLSESNRLKEGSGQMLGNGWRDAVNRATGCDREETMGELVRCACQALMEAYRSMDNAPKQARKEEMAA